MPFYGKIKFFPPTAANIRKWKKTLPAQNVFTFCLPSEYKKNNFFYFFDYQNIKC